jgi:Holliday junction resolvase-like predicted endonuclease
VMYQLIPFHKPNKKVRSEKMMDCLIPKTKHTITVTSRYQSNFGEADLVATKNILK